MGVLEGAMGVLEGGVLRGCVRAVEGTLQGDGRMLWEAMGGRVVAVSSGERVRMATPRGNRCLAVWNLIRFALASTGEHSTGGEQVQPRVSNVLRAEGSSRCYMGSHGPPDATWGAMEQHSAHPWPKRASPGVLLGHLAPRDGLAGPVVLLALGLYQTGLLQ